MTAATVAAPGGVASDRRPLAVFAAGPVAVIALVKIAFHLGTANIYGLHRDEFYYLAGGRRLAWGYVDHPPGTPFLYRVGETVFGDSQLGLHVMPALVGALLAVLAALVARELGGGRRAQAFTAFAVAASPMSLITSHFLSTVSVEIVAWTAATWLVIRLLRTGDVRLWVAIGAVVGLGLLDKHSVLFWVAGMSAGFLLTPARRLLRTPWLVAGVVVAGVIVAPHVAWQIDHGWPTLEFLRHLRQRTSSAENLIEFLPQQLGIIGVVSCVVWIPGVRWLFSGRNRWRPVAIAWIGVLVLVLLARGKPYYVGPIYPALLAAGAVVVESRWTVQGLRRFAALVLVTEALWAPMFIPLLPASALETVPLDKVNKDLGGMLGWHRVATTVASVYHSLPADEQAGAIVFTSDYSEAGAVEYWRGSLGLPQPISGHNNYWYWGYGDGHVGTTVFVGYPESFVRRFFTDVRVGAVLKGPALDDQEVGVRIWVCRGQRRPWAAIWPELKHFE